jgi:ligand-binding sensor domain-containing protein/signal transduction histidine kinase
MRLRFLLWSVIILSLFQLRGFGQDIHFEVIEPPKDVPWQLISGISQGPDGFLWLANYTGVYRYDGEQFTHYLHDPKNPNSIADNRNECILAANDGIIWIGTYVTGLDHLDPQTGIVTHFRHQVNDPSSLSNDTVTALMQDKQGNLWVGTYGGLDRFDPQTRTFKHFTHITNDSASLSNNLVRAIYEDHEGMIWIGTGSPFGENANQGAAGLNRLDPKTGVFSSYKHDPKNPGSITDNRVRAIFEDSKGNLWVGTAGDGLQTLDRATGIFTHYYSDPVHPEKLSRPPLKKTLPYADDHVTFITEDNGGRIWIVTMEGGINVYDPSTKKVTHYGFGKNSKETLATDQFWYGYKSSDGIIWISSWGATNQIYNLYKINPFQNKLPFHEEGLSINAFAEDNFNSIWLASRSGLIHIDSTGKEKKFFISTDSASPKNGMIFLKKDIKSNTFWVGTPRGFYHFDPATGIFTRYHHQEGDNNSLLSDTVLAESQDMKDRLWVGTFRGLQLMDIKTGKFVERIQDNSSVFNNGDIISDILIDKNNHLWAATADGLKRFDEENGHPEKYYFKGQGGVGFIKQDSTGNIWAGTGVGLYRYNTQTDEFSLFTDASGLLSASTSISSLTEDHEKNLWLGTNKGIIKLNVEKNTTVVYGKNRGVDANGITLGYTRENGEILYGNNLGYFAFHPEDLMHNIPPPNLSITNFLLASKPVVVGKGGILPQALSETKMIHLQHNQNTFSFEFASIDFAGAGENNHLQYILEGYDHNWQLAGENKTAYYFNVTPGTYVFNLKALNDGGVWTEKNIIIIISPPWWLTWWAYTIYIICFLAVSFIVNRYIRNRIVVKERMKSREKELLQAKEIEKAYHELKSTQAQLIQSEKMASLGELTAGIAHEIQNPLNFVNNFSEVNQELIAEMKEELAKGNTEEAAKIMGQIGDNEEKIMHHGKRADAIVKNMLQHSRTSTNIKEPTDLNALADEYFRLAYHGMRSKDKSFNATMQSDYDGSIALIPLIPQDMGRVLLNLYNNAFYAVFEKKKTIAKGYEPTVSVNTKKVNDIIEIKIKDNGNGISLKIIDKIFQPFFTTKPAGLGTGLGLSLSYDIIKTHGGDIKVNTKEGEFTEFVIRVPAV